MAEARAEAAHEVQCPHCRKTFRAEPMLGDAERYRGFKCPHCKLFVPLDRSGASPDGDS